LFPKVPLRLQPNVPKKSRQQPGSPWLLRDECTATRSLGAESNTRDEEESSHQQRYNGRNVSHGVSEEENGGACQLYEVCQPPRPSPPLHYHVDFIEIFTVKQGQLDIYVDRDRKHLLLLPADSATAHVRQPHRTGLPTTAAQPKMDYPRIQSRGWYLSRPPKATCPLSHRHFRESRLAVPL